MYVCPRGVKVMFTTLASNVATFFILDMFVSKHCFTQILCPFLGAPNRLWCFGCSTLWVFLHGGLYHFFAQDDFFQNPSQSPWLSMYVAQSSSTSTTLSTSHRSNNNMHCYIDGEAFKSIIWTKFETSYFDVSSVYNLNTS
jgi:hypothetical protein